MDQNYDFLEIPVDYSSDDFPHIRGYAQVGVAEGDDQVELYTEDAGPTGVTIRMDLEETQNLIYRLQEALDIATGNSGE